MSDHMSPKDRKADFAPTDADPNDRDDEAFVDAIHSGRIEAADR
jgi:hypothetical protein